MSENDFGAVPKQTLYDAFPKPTMLVTVRTSNIFAGLQSRVKRVRAHEGTVEITTPYDVSGDPFFIPIGEKIAIEWDLSSEARQQEFFVKEYHEVTDFLKDEKKRPSVILSLAPSVTEKQFIERAYYRTTLKIPIELYIDDKEKKSVEMVDISGGGIAFTYERPIPLQKNLTIIIPYTHSKSAIHDVEVTGKIVNLSMIHPREYRMGIQFDRILEKDRDAVIRFVNYCTGKKRAGDCRNCPMRKQQKCSH